MRFARTAGVPLPAEALAGGVRQHRRVFDIAPQSGPDMAGLVATLIGDIGRPTFAAVLGGALGTVSSAVQCNVFQIGRDNAVRCLFHWSRQQPAGRSAAIVDRYLAGPVLADPVLRRLRREQGDGRSPTSSTYFLRSSDIADRTYRQTFFDACALGGKMSVYQPAAQGGIYLNFYSPGDRQEFPPREIDALAFLSPVIASSLVRHDEICCRERPAAIALRLDEIKRLLAEAAPMLTRRELDVCARIVAGYTTEAIALDLGISHASVATYRRRAYGRLAISSQHELFALCLVATSRRPPA